MILYVNGCSHTEGHHLEKKYIWPNLLKETLGNSYELINDAMCGAGNDHILHQSLESISKLINQNKKPNLVIIQWSSPYRRLHCTIDGIEKFINSDDNSEYGLKFEPMASKHTLHYMYVLQQFLKDNDINYLFFNYFGIEKEVKDLEIFNQIDFENFITFDIDNVLYSGIINFMKEKKFTFDKPGHPNEIGHSYICNSILSKLNISKEVI